VREEEEEEEEELTRWSHVSFDEVRQT